MATRLLLEDFEQAEEIRGELKRKPLAEQLRLFGKARVLGERERDAASLDGERELGAGERMEEKAQLAAIRGESEKALNP